MSTSQTIGLSEPTGSTKISIGTLGYINARNRQRAYDLVIKEFKKSDLTQADLARRLGKAQEVISRLLSRPQNWELDTFSELLFGISGAVAAYTATYPLAKSNVMQITQTRAEQSDRNHVVNLMDILRDRVQSTGAAPKPYQASTPVRSNAKIIEARAL
jgi:hypothetical protein